MSRRAAWLWVAAYFAAALLPRLSPLLSGALFADDLIHRPEGHLQSYRFLNFAELWFWQFVFGPRYLSGAVAKIIAALYTTGLCVALRATLREWDAAPRVAGLLPLVVPLHPLWNTFIAVPVAGVYAVSLLLIVIGYRLIPRRLGAAVLLMALGISGYQVHVGLLPGLIFAELVLSKEKRRLRVAVRRCLACVAAMAVYFAAIKLAAWAGLQTWGGRGLASSFSGLAGGASPVKAIADNLGVITQPLLSFYGGVAAAWSFWWVPFAVACVLSGIAFRSIRVALLALLLPLSAASVVLLLNVPATGPRVTGAIWLATLLALLPFLEQRRWAMPLFAALFIALSLPVALTDARNRTLAWQADQRTVAAIGAPAGTRVELYQSAVRPAVPQGRPIVMQNFEPVFPSDYSNVIHRPVWLFQWYGFDVADVGTAMPRPPAQRSDLAEWRHEPSERRVLFAPYDGQH